MIRDTPGSRPSVGMVSMPFRQVRSAVSPQSNPERLCPCYGPSCTRSVSRRPPVGLYHRFPSGEPKVTTLFNNFLIRLLNNFRFIFLKGY